MFYNNNYQNKIQYSKNFSIVSTKKIRNFSTDFLLFLILNFDISPITKLNNSTIYSFDSKANPAPQMRPLKKPYFCSCWTLSSGLLSSEAKFRFTATKSFFSAVLLLTGSQWQRKNRSGLESPSYMTTWFFTHPSTKGWSASGGKGRGYQNWYRNTSTKRYNYHY